MTIGRAYTTLPQAPACRACFHTSVIIEIGPNPGYGRFGLSQTEHPKSGYRFKSRSQNRGGEPPPPILKSGKCARPAGRAFSSQVPPRDPASRSDGCPKASDLRTPRICRPRSRRPMCRSLRHSNNRPDSSWEPRKGLWRSLSSTASKNQRTTKHGSPRRQGHVDKVRIPVSESL
jgi:hypothetical protein